MRLIKLQYIQGTLCQLNISPIPEPKVHITCEAFRGPYVNNRYVLDKAHPPKVGSPPSHFHTDHSRCLYHAVAGKLHCQPGDSKLRQRVQHTNNNGHLYLYNVLLDEPSHINPRTIQCATSYLKATAGALYVIIHKIDIKCERIMILMFKRET